MELFIDMAHNARAPSPVFGRPKRRATKAAAPQQMSEMQMADQDGQPDVEYEGQQPAPVHRPGPLHAPPDDADEEQCGDRCEAPVGGEEFHARNLAQSAWYESETSSGAR
jgi:hypothetical protein